MASLWKHPKSKYWTACYTDSNGKQRKKSTKLTSRAAAQKMADSLEQAHKRKMSEAQIRKLFSEAYREIHGDELRSATIGDYLKEWIKRKEKEVSSVTWEKYRNISERFIEYMGSAASNDLNYLTTKTFVGFRDTLAKDIANATVNGYMKILRVAINDAWKDDLLSDNPAAKVPRLKVGNGSAENKRRTFSLDELKKILSAANDEWKGIILCGLYTGQRLGDIVRLRWNAIDLESREVNFLTRKTSRPVIIYIVDPLYEYILSVKGSDDPNAPLFPEANKKISKAGQTSGLSNQFYDIMVSAGLAEYRPHTKQLEEGKKTRTTNPLSFHCFRHTATSLMKNGGTSESVAMDIIGHESKAISRNYTHIDPETKKKALESLPDITK